MKTPARRLLILLSAWALAAGVAGGFQLIAHLPAPAVPLLVASLSIGASVAAGRVGWLKEAIRGMGVREILAAHSIRFVGFYFLWLYSQGRMPAEFAQRAGWGDVAAATGALGLLFWPESAGFRRALFVWNIVGLLDLFLALGTGAWVNVARPGSMIEIAGLPLALVPLMLVPVLIASHGEIFRRFARGDFPRAGAAARA